MWAGPGVAGITLAGFGLASTTWTGSGVTGMTWTTPDMKVGTWKCSGAGTAQLRGSSSATLTVNGQPASKRALSIYFCKTAHFRVAFYCGQPKAHLCNNHAVISILICHTCEVDGLWMDANEKCSLTQIQTDLWTIFERNRPFVYIEKVLDLWVQLMKNGGKNKSVAFIILVIIYIYIYNTLVSSCLWSSLTHFSFNDAPNVHRWKIFKHLTQLFVENNLAFVLFNIYPELGCI